MLFFCANPLRFEINYVALPTVKDSWLRKYVKDNFFHIAAFWDTRREPKKQVRQTE